ncbi:testis-expressed protein 9 isoform X2 [Cherax quadricarinatus]|nr:uncharacterized protein LOC128684896 isoform X2 [Cherax quadricarinatus]
MASDNKYYRGHKHHCAVNGDAASIAVPALFHQHSCGGKDSRVVPEDDILLQMDQELDQRLSQLRRLGLGRKSSHFSMSMESSTQLKISPRGLDSKPRSFVLSGASSSNSIRDKQNVKIITNDGHMAANTCKSDGNLTGGPEAQSTPSDESDGCSPRCNSQSKRMGDKLNSSSSVCEGKLKGTMSALERSAVEAELVGNVNNEVEVDDDKEEAIFDEFLDQSTRVRISILTKKVKSLSETLKLSQEECKRLVHAKRVASVASSAAETERRNINKKVQNLHQENSKLQKSNKHLLQRVKELNGECQVLRKELASTQHSKCGHCSSQSFIQAQLTRARADNAALRDHTEKLKMKHKEELDQLHASVTSSNARIKELEREKRNFSALVKKQEHLITVLNEQKNNIAAAKAVACLEDRFLAIISPLQPP